MNPIGVIKSGLVARDGVVETLKLWSDFYIGETAEQYGLERSALPAFRSMTTSTSDVDRLAEDQLPACIVVGGGLDSPPRRQGNGDYNANFSIAIGVIVGGRDERTTENNLQLYVAAVRSAVLQNPSLGGVALGLEWVDESYDLLPFEDKRTILGGQVNLSVEIESVLASRAGIETPPDNPRDEPMPIPQVLETNVSLAKLDIE